MLNNIIFQELEGNNIRLEQNLKENEIQKLIQGLLYCQDLTINSFLPNDELLFLSQQLGNLKQLISINILIKRDSISSSESLVQLAKNIENLTNLKSFSFSLEVQSSEININEMFIELGKGLAKLNHMQKLSFQLFHNAKFQIEGMKSLKKAIKQLKQLNSFSLDIYLFSQVDEQLLKKLLSPLKKSTFLTELSLTVNRYSLKGKKNDITQQPQLFDFESYSKLKSLNLRIDNKVKDYDIGIISLAQSLKYLQNLNKFSLEIFQFNLNNQQFSDFYSNLFMLPNLEELQTILLMDRYLKNEEMIIGEMIHDYSILKKLYINITGVKGSQTLKIGKEFHKLKQLTYLKMDLQQIKFCEQNLKILSTSCSELETLHLILKDNKNVQQGQILVDCLKNWLKLKELSFNFAISGQDSSQYPVINAISNLENLQILKIVCQLSYLTIMKEQDFIECFQKLKNLTELELTCSDYPTNLNLLYFGHSLKYLQNLIKLTVYFDILQYVEEIQLIGNNMKYLQKLKYLKLSLITFRAYREYELESQQIIQITQGIKELSNLVGLEITLDTQYSNQLILLKEISISLNNHQNLNTILINYFQQKRFKQEQSIVTLIKNQKRLVNLRNKYG